MKTIEIKYKNACPYCKSESSAQLIHVDGFGFWAADRKCAVCGKQYHVRVEIYNERAKAFFDLADRNIEHIEDRDKEI